MDALYTSRREFLSGSLRFLSVAATMPLFLGRSAIALAEPQGKAKRRDDASRILVVVQLAGGNDGLNMVIPYEDDVYRRLRPQLAITKDKVLPLKGGMALHPAAEGLKSLYDAGRLAVVQNVGYPNPNRSHFVSMDIWHTADPEQRRHTGWLGRYEDACCKGDDPPKPTQAIALMKDSPLALTGERFAPLAFESPDDLTWKAGNRNAAAAAAFRKLNAGDEDAAAHPAREDMRQFLERAAGEALVGIDDIRSGAGKELRGGGGRGQGGGALHQQLTMVARMIAADLPTRVYYLSLGGFDTHSGQLGRQQALLRQLGDALDNFVTTLDEHGLLDRVLIMTFSEFGRRVQENASGGTDHGEAAPMLLIGSSLKSGLHGSNPDLANLNRGDLPHTCDFRQVYAAALRDWLGMPAKDVGAVLGGGYGQTLRVIRT